MFRDRYKQNLVDIENVTLHFVHEKSKSPGAIPILMAHGWPGPSYSSTLLCFVI